MGAVKVKANATEWKVRIAALASFVGSLAAGILIEQRSVDIVNALPSGLKVVGASVLVATGAWFSGRAARSRPEYISESTMRAVSECADRYGK